MSEGLKILTFIFAHISSKFGFDFRHQSHLTDCDFKT